MKFHELTLTPKPNRKRVGRGIGSGRGKTAGRGTKGQNSRTGHKLRPGFEGGQNPLAVRLPKKRGFTSKRQPLQNIHTDQLNSLGAGPVDVVMLEQAGLVANARRPVKLLYRGEVTKKMTLRVHSTSHKARLAVEAAGGKIEPARLNPVKESPKR